MPSQPRAATSSGMHGQEPGRRIHATYMGPRRAGIKRRWFLTVAHVRYHRGSRTGTRTHDRHPGQPARSSATSRRGFERAGSRRWSRRAGRSSGPSTRSSAAEEPTGVLWERGPVEPPADPFAEPVADRSGPPPLPPPDPSFAAVVVEEPEEEIPEVSAEDVEEVLESPEAPAAVAAVSWVDEEGSGGEVVSLDALLATPPPAAPSRWRRRCRPRFRRTSSPPRRRSPRSRRPGPPASDPFSPSPSFVSGEHRVVLHTVEGQVMRGLLANADLADAELPLLQPNGAVARVPAEQPEGRLLHAAVRGAALRRRPARGCASPSATAGRSPASPPSTPPTRPGSSSCRSTRGPTPRGSGSTGARSSTSPSARPRPLS